MALTTLARVPARRGTADCPPPPPPPLVAPPPVPAPPPPLPLPVPAATTSTSCTATAASTTTARGGGKLGSKVLQLHGGILGEIVQRLRLHRRLIAEITLTVISPLEV